MPLIQVIESWKKWHISLVPINDSFASKLLLTEYETLFFCVRYFLRESSGDGVFCVAAMA